MKCSHKTTNGIVRNTNQDCICTDLTNRIFIIADGIGGHSNGALASKIATETCFSVISKGINESTNFDAVDLIANAIIEANSVVFKEWMSGEKPQQMGTTISCVLIKNSTMYFGYVGDSRLYIQTQKNKGINQITRDHTVAEEMIRKGLPPNFMSHNKSVLTKSVGINKYVTPSVGEITLYKGDTVLMCTDGLTDYIDDKSIGHILFKHQNNINSCSDALITCAEKGHSRDNISIIVIKI